MTHLALTILRRLLPLLALFVVVPAAQAAPCATNCIAPGDYDMQIQSGGYLRLYKVHVPARYTGQQAVALLLDLHGHALTNADQRKNSGHLAQSDRLGFIVAWPQGIANSWNGQGCCTVAYDLKIDDVGFLRAVIAELSRRTNIDPAKVYVSGWSNGGGMTQRMACEAADLVTAVAPVAHPVNSQDCRPARPISVLAFHGYQDTVIPYAGGGQVLPREVLGVPLGWQGAVESLETWARISGCTGLPEAVQLAGASRDQTYRTCANGVINGLVTIADSDHDVYTDNGKPGHVDIAAYMWSHIFRP